MEAKLWASIEAFKIDDEGVRFTFEQKLAQRQGWTADHARRAVHEYKRFVYLAMVSPTEVSPSPDVDEVWHLHLIHTVSYWERMAPLLPRRLHHHPSKGGGLEQKRIEGQYGQTLRLYQETFGEPAPTDLWPRTSPPSGTKDRPAAPIRHLTVERRRLRTGLTVAGLVGSVGLGAGCAPLLAQQGADGFGLALLGVGGTVVIVLIIAAVVSARNRTGRGGGSAGGIHPGLGINSFTDPNYLQTGGADFDATGSGHASGTGHEHGGDASTDSVDAGQSAVSGSSSDSGSSDSSSGGDSSSGCGGGGCGGGGD